MTTWHEYLYAGGELVGEHFTKSDSTTYTYFFVTDHLGSVAVLTDELGTVTERLSYDAHFCFALLRRMALRKRRGRANAGNPMATMTLWVRCQLSW